VLHVADGEAVIEAGEEVIEAGEEITVAASDYTIAANSAFIANWRGSGALRQVRVTTGDLTRTGKRNRHGVEDRFTLVGDAVRKLGEADRPAGQRPDRDRQYAGGYSLGGLMTTPVPGWVLPAAQLRFDPAVPSRVGTHAYKALRQHGPLQIRRLLRRRYRQLPCEDADSPGVFR
jgi:hypothetical protein